MNTHQIIVSQMCRVLAHSTRLQLLWAVFEDEKLCVRDLARQTGISESNASNQLRALAAKELITSQRGKLKVFYAPVDRPETLCAKTLLPELRKCQKNGVSFKTVIREATAFTHDRRIQIVRCLAASDEPFTSLLEKTGMTTSPLNRHLKKLSNRNFIQKQGKVYHLRQPDSMLARRLLKLAIHQPEKAPYL